MALNRRWKEIEKVVEEGGDRCEENVKHLMVRVLFDEKFFERMRSSLVAFGGEDAKKALDTMLKAAKEKKDKVELGRYDPWRELFQKMKDAEFLEDEWLPGKGMVLKWGSAPLPQI